MIYRGISLARVMRLIALKQTENLFFQETSNLELRKFDLWEFKSNDFHYFKFFEREDK